MSRWIQTAHKAMFQALTGVCCLIFWYWIATWFMSFLPAWIAILIIVYLVCVAIYAIVTDA